MTEFENASRLDDRQHVRLSPVPVITPTDVADTLRGLEPGRYFSADLWARYLETMERQGREPASRRAWAIALKAANVYQTMIYKDGSAYRGWMIGTAKDTLSEMPS